MMQRTKPQARDDAPVAGARRRGLDARVEGVAVRTWIVIGVLIAATVIGFGTWWVYGLGRTTGMEGMGARQGEMTQGGMAQGGMEEGAARRFPAVVGFYDGAQVLFAHTEASDPEVADMLTGMMGSPVLVVPELADVPESALGTVYVFANGVEPEGAAGPFGFQPDVFDSVPGDSDYTPLRAVVLVRWEQGEQPRTLASAIEIEDAVSAGSVTLEETGVVVNMPFLAWPGGSR